MANNNNIIANPLVILREEFDDWAVLFDPDSGKGCGLNPVGVYIWKRLDGKHTVEAIVKALRVDCNNVPDNADNYVNTFVADLLERGLAGSELPQE
ncbi:MAG: SynChlorMet cassette protein ScmD [Proteobacteria bacterium]|nr:SynChlorMet cassette protein ScmD [Pseudomonadota bacterium]